MKLRWKTRKIKSVDREYRVQRAGIKRFPNITIEIEFSYFALKKNMKSFFLNTML